MTADYQRPPYHLGRPAPAAPTPCPHCQGTGTCHNRLNSWACVWCSGTGTRATRGAMADKAPTPEPCPECRGWGRITEQPPIKTSGMLASFPSLAIVTCQRCSGTGIAPPAPHPAPDLAALLREAAAFISRGEAPRISECVELRDRIRAALAAHERTGGTK